MVNDIDRIMLGFSLGVLFMQLMKWMAERMARQFRDELKRKMESDNNA